MENSTIVKMKESLFKNLMLRYLAKNIHDAIYAKFEKILNDTVYSMHRHAPML